MPKRVSSSSALASVSIKTGYPDEDAQSPRTDALQHSALTPAMRKRKNADAQAAFRVRRTNYIATLEETVTRLETAVRGLQDQCRDFQEETDELREENLRLKARIDGMKQTEKERERMWKVLESKRGRGADNGNGEQYTQRIMSPQMTSTFLQHPQPLPTYITGPMGWAGGAILENPNNPYLQFPDYQAHTVAPPPIRGPHQMSAMNYGGAPAGVRITTLAAPTQMDTPIGSPVMGYHNFGTRQHLPYDEQEQGAQSSRIGRQSLPELNTTLGGHDHSMNHPKSPTQYSSTTLMSPTTETGYMSYPSAHAHAHAHAYHYHGTSGATEVPELSRHAYAFEPHMQVAGTGMENMGMERLDGLVPMQQDGGGGGNVQQGDGSGSSSVSEDTASVYRGRTGSDMELDQSYSSDTLLPVKRSAQGSRSHTPRPRTRVRRNTPPTTIGLTDTNGNPLVSDTLAVLKAQAFGAGRKRRAGKAREEAQRTAQTVVQALTERGLGMGIGTRRRRKRESSDPDETMRSD